MLMPSIFGEDLFDDFMRFPMEHEMRTRGAQANKELMRTDIREVDGNYELDIELPGYKKEDMKLQLKDGYLTIQASRSEDKEEKDSKGRYIRRERFNGHCSRSFFVGRSISQEDVHARYEDGILKLSFPKEDTKKEMEEKKYIAIEG